jgi:hypothetical protein
VPRHTIDINAKHFLQHCVCVCVCVNEVFTPSCWRTVVPAFKCRSAVQFTVTIFVCVCVLCVCECVAQGHMLNLKPATWSFKIVCARVCVCKILQSVGCRCVCVCDGSPFQRGMNDW